MDVEKKVRQTIKKYRLLEKGDKVMVALSGGKDSTAVLWLLHKLGYDVFGLMVDLGLGNWSEKNRKNMEGFCNGLGIEFFVVDLRKEFGMSMAFIKNIIREKKNLTGCYICGVLKKWILNKKARELGADKIVTGHNLDDETQTILMNFLKGNVLLAGGYPVTGFGKKVQGFVTRIKPLFFVPELDIKKFSKKNNFPVIYEKCPCGFGSYRIETREWFDEIGLDSKDKLKIVENWLKISKDFDRKKKLGFCESCGEPASGNLCQACGLLKLGFD